MNIYLLRKKNNILKNKNKLKDKLDPFSLYTITTYLFIQIFFVIMFHEKIRYLS